MSTLREGRGRVQDIVLDLVSMCAAVDKDLFHASIGQELKGIFYQRCVRQWKKTLPLSATTLSQYSRLHTLGLSSVKGVNRVSKGSARIYNAPYQ